MDSAFHEICGKRSEGLNLWVVYMTKKLTFYMMSHSGSKVRQMTFSRKTICVAAAATVIGAAGMGWLVKDYAGNRSAVMQLEQLQADLAQKTELINRQHQQIQEFGAKINTLKDQMVTLKGFENKVRIIANLEVKESDTGVFGVGGSVPEDLDTRLGISETHSSLIREIHDQVALLETGSVAQIEGFESLLKALEDQRNLLAATPAIRPAKGWVTSKFGYRTSPFTGRREFHKGLDIANRMGTPVFATADGVITFAGSRGLIGNVVVIDHGHGLVTRYGHLKSSEVKRGDRVKRGDKIALMGNTGRSTGPHVHYEVRLNGMPVNPVKYILN